MTIPRKPDRKTENVNNFIKTAPTQNRTKANGEKRGRKVISLSLMVSDADWVDETLEQINSLSQRKITRSEIISAALSRLKEKSIEEITNIIKNR